MVMGLCLGWRAEEVWACGGLQMSIATGLPLAVVLLKALPVRDGSPTSMDGLAPVYGVVPCLQNSH